ncbi:AcrR family transcriptional regulator [Spinactinospora alkalitolerans]|uniref:AcrR family transcriptional regulator n=1 Tax=Spinactinospora alkalitolerans TaxID=687207 RepID=A0A852U2R3_9ACTN|nr:TetR/AcrR family transcriptional regulator [Spinactinospora alkalitolerans]NYE49223.1 AcrR family transcriptional regulator [Spinactinospora alkalitolerans]
MPKLVDHQARRREIIEATWELIAEQGIDNVSVRDIAKAASYAAPGALNHYFGSKDQLLAAAYQLVCDRTDERIAEVTAGRTGLEALELMCGEIVPADPLTRIEARVALSFWQRAQHEEALRSIGRTALASWKQQIVDYLEAATADGEIRPAAPSLIADQLIALMMGLHVTSMLDEEFRQGTLQLVAAHIETLRR